MKSIFITAIVVIIGVTLSSRTWITRNPIPPHLMGHTLVDKTNFLSEAIVDELLQATRLASPIYSTTKEPEVFQTIEDNIGEATSVNENANGNSRCPHKLLTLDNTGKRCVLPGRIDVGLHYLKTGGVEAKKENLAKLTSRVQPFLHYILDYKSNNLTKRLLESPEMVAFARNVCPKGKPYLDPFQFNFVVQVPGQTVATHVDAVYFRHASRFHIPQWLLAVLHFSGLAKEEFVDQVQIVAYYHKWQDERAGKFLFWNDPETLQPQISLPLSRSANSVDGSKVVHAAGVYMPWRDPPILPRASRNTLVYRGGENHMWDVKSDGAVLASYPESDLRFSAVYRCRCFKSEEDKKAYDEDQLPGKAWNVEYVLNLLRKDLAKKGVLEIDAQISRMDLAVLLLETYVKYPVSPTAPIPFNLCAIPEVDALSWLKPFFAQFC